MDAKLEMFLEYDRWAELFPAFRKKGINQQILALLAQPRYRNGIAAMIADGHYRIDPPREAVIPKDDGGVRKIYILDDLDRCIMAVISSVYTDLYHEMIHPGCKSYQRGISVPHTLHSLMREVSHGGYKVDLSKYFDSVSRSAINGMLCSMDTGSTIDKVLYEFYNTDEIIRDGKICRHFKSLAQGCSFSALLANICLRDIDAAMTKMCSTYLRYSDDILILGESADDALKFLTESLSGFGLSLNPKKIQKIFPDDEFTFLGGRVCSRWVHVSEKSMIKQKKEIRRIVGKCHKAGSRAVQKQAVRRLQKHFIETLAILEQAGGFVFRERSQFLPLEFINKLYHSSTGTYYEAVSSVSDLSQDFTPELAKRYAYLYALAGYFYYMRNRIAFSFGSEEKFKEAAKGIPKMNALELTETLEALASDLYADASNNPDKFSERKCKIRKPAVSHPENGSGLRTMDFF